MAYDCIACRSNCTSFSCIGSSIEACFFGHSRIANQVMPTIRARAPMALTVPAMIAFLFVEDGEEGIALC